MVTGIESQWCVFRLMVDNRSPRREAEAEWEVEENMEAKEKSENREVKREKGEKEKEEKQGKKVKLPSE